MLHSWHNSNRIRNLIFSLIHLHWRFFTWSFTDGRDLRICALQVCISSKCTHTAVSIEHKHTVNTHPEQYKYSIHTVCASPYLWSISPLSFISALLKLAIWGYFTQNLPLPDIKNVEYNPLVSDTPGYHFIVWFGAQQHFLLLSMLKNVVLMHCDSVLMNSLMNRV